MCLSVHVSGDMNPNEHEYHGTPIIPDQMDDCPKACKVIYLHQHESVIPEPAGIKGLLLTLKKDNESLLRSLEELHGENP